MKIKDLKPSKGKHADNVFVLLYHKNKIAIPRSSDIESRIMMCLHVMLLIDSPGPHDALEAFDLYQKLSYDEFVQLSRKVQPDRKMK